MIKENKILFLLHLPPPVHGSSVVGLFIAESERLNMEFKCTYVNLLASQNVAETGKINIRKLLGFVPVIFRIISTLILNRPKLCYLALTTTGAAFYKDLFLVGILKIFRIKYIYHLHNKGISINQHKAFNRTCYRFVFKNAQVILLSKHLYPDIQSFVSESNIHICPNGIPDSFPFSKINSSETSMQDLKNQNNLANRIQDIEKSKPVQILFLSNLIESKGVYILLDACAILKNKNIQFKCIFIGGESDISIGQFNERVAQLKLNDYVNYQGKRYGMEKYNAFAEADIFAFPTYYYYETFGLVNLEAMQQSKPIVSTFEGGIPDVIEDGITGFLVPQKNATALAEKLELLITNPELRLQMGASGLEKYKREFTLEIFENRLSDILHEVIEMK